MSILTKTLLYPKMVLNLILLLALINSFHFKVNCIPMSSEVYRELLNNPTADIDDDSEIVEIASNQIPEDEDSNLIDLSVYGLSLYGVPDTNKTGQLVAKFKPNKTSVNPEELGSYLEGDILVPQNLVILKNGLPSKTSRWPDGKVPFEIAGDFTKNELDVIASAIDEYHARTCIRFVSHTTETDYISIVSGNSGCWSSIGRVGGKQEVNLQSPGCLTKHGTAIHELMHVLGFLHEQNRQERDSYVKIQYQNIHQKAVPNFEKVPKTAAFGVGYDYGSVMHYSPSAFSHNGKPTIVAKKPNKKKVMGQRDGFSPMDVEKINRMYNCKLNRKPEEPPIILPPRVLSSRFPFAESFANNPIGTFIGNIFSGLSKIG